MSILGKWQIKKVIIKRDESFNPIYLSREEIINNNELDYINLLSGIIEIDSKYLSIIIKSSDDILNEEGFVKLDNDSYLVEKTELVYINNKAYVKTGYDEINNKDILDEIIELNNNELQYKTMILERIN